MNQQLFLFFKRFGQTLGIILLGTLLVVITFGRNKWMTNATATFQNDNAAANINPTKEMPPTQLDQYGQLFMNQRSRTSVDQLDENHLTMRNNTSYNDNFLESNR